MPALARTLFEHTPPRQRWGAGRAFAAGWLVLYAAFGVGLPLMDAATNHAERVVAHWEDTSDASCPAVHDSECRICQSVTGCRALPTSAVALVTRHAAELPVGTDDHRALVRGYRDGRASRAPPLG